MEMSNETFNIIVDALDTVEKNQRDYAHSFAHFDPGVKAYWLTKADKTARAAHDIRIIKAYCEEPNLTLHTWVG